MSFVADAPSVSRAAARGQAAYDRLFYGTMAVALALVVFAGFGPSYYFRFFSGGPQATVSGGPFTGLIHLHGALFTGWGSPAKDDLDAAGRGPGSGGAGPC